MNIEQKRQEIESLCQRLSEGCCIYDLKQEGWNKCPEQKLITCGRCLISELASQGVVIKVDKPLPINPYSAPYKELYAENQKIADLVYCGSQQDVIDAGFTATESLIDKPKEEK